MKILEPYSIKKRLVKQIKGADILFSPETENTHAVYRLVLPEGNVWINAHTGEIITIQGGRP
jgi:hypothetical protein